MQSKKLTSQDSNKPCTVIGEASCFVNEIPTVIGKEFPAISSVRILTEKEMAPEFLKTSDIISSANKSLIKI